MSSKARLLIVGNWKMNGSRRALSEVEAAARGYGAQLRGACELVICPPASLTFLTATAALGTGICVGAQNCHAEASGAFTGEISAELLADCGASYVIVGHSERRSLFAETDAQVKAKAQAAQRAGLVPIICVGETRAEREGGHALTVVCDQLARSVPTSEGPTPFAVAYEPVWAIGTGLTPTHADIAEVHARIHRDLGMILGADRAASVRILYGGSVKPANAREILSIAHVSGALVGGASLKADDFLAIANAALS